MIVLLVLGIVVLALVLLSLIRVGVWVEYAQKTFTVRLLAGPVRVTLFPRKAKQPKPAKAKKAKASKQKKSKPPKKPKTAGEIFDLVKELLPVVTDAAGQLRRLERRSYEKETYVRAGGPGADRTDGGIASDGTGGRRPGALHGLSRNLGKGRGQREYRHACIQ